VLNNNVQINGDLLKPVDKKQLIQNQCINILIIPFNLN